MENLPDITPQKEFCTEEVTEEAPIIPRKRRRVWGEALALLSVFVLGLFGGYYLNNYLAEQKAIKAQEIANQAIVEKLNQINPPEGYALPIQYNDLGPQMLAAGVIDMAAFIQVFESSNHPLSSEQKDILQNGNDAQIIFTKQNAHFLLDFFWAVGLANQNSLMTEGPIMQYSQGEIGRFASTGGWTIGTKSPAEIFASLPLVALTKDQQARLDEVAFAVFRPCCNNPAAFPDCNHGMAMLAMLEMMAAQDASVQEMFEAAKYANAFWYPQQTLELATLFEQVKEQNFAEADAQLVVSGNLSSADGFKKVHQFLVSNNNSEQAPDQGNNSCGT